MRRPSQLKNLVLRHKVVQVMRNFLDKEGFLEIETPVLGKSTPEGARDYLVPSRVHPGNFHKVRQKAISHSTEGNLSKVLLELL